jgi:hypothetical protein
MSDTQRGFGLDIGFINYFNTQFVITLNYSAIADLHTLRITTSHANYFQSAVSLVVYWLRFLTVEILQLLRSVRCPLVLSCTKSSLQRLPYNYQCFIWLTHSLTVISHQPHSLLYTDWQLFESESESESLYIWRFTANHFVLVTSPLRLTTSNYLSTEHLLS